MEHLGPVQAAWPRLAAVSEQAHPWQESNAIADNLLDRSGIYWRSGQQWGKPVTQALLPEELRGEENPLSKKECALKCGTSLPGSLGILGWAMFFVESKRTEIFLLRLKMLLIFPQSKVCPRDHSCNHRTCAQTRKDCFSWNHYHLCYWDHLIPLWRCK